MTHEQFESILLRTQQEDRDILCAKSAEYATGADKLSNFKKAARSLGVKPEQALWYFMQKHTTSVQDIINGESEYTYAKMAEKAGDMRRYLVLLEALMMERYT